MKKKTIKINKKDIHIRGFWSYREEKNIAGFIKNCIQCF